MLLVTLIALILAAQTPRAPATLPRDARPDREGTAIIRGRVTAGDTGQPLRRAFVSLSGGPMPAGASVVPGSGTGAMSGPRGPRTIATNSDGRFEFTGLAAGTYRIRVTAGQHRAQYLSLPFGGRTSMEAGRAIELKDGEQFLANVALPRGGAIVGRVVDDFGEPVSRAMVFPSRVMPGGAIQRTGAGDSSDDLGRFRIFGLEPGDYVVGAEARGMGGPPVEGASEGFITTYFPSALTDREGTRVRVAGSGETGDVEIVLVRTRTFRITGTIMDSQGRVVQNPNVMLVRPSGGGGFSTAGGFSTPDATGKFTIRDVVPGEYRLVVRPMGGPQPESPQPGQPPRETATVPLSVSSDIDDLVVVTQPGATVSGQVVFAEGAPATAPSGLRVLTQPGDRWMTMGPPPSATVGTNLQFTLNDLSGSHLIRLAGLPPGFAVKAVMLGATDVIDTPVELKSTHSRQLQIVVTGRASTIDGTVTDDRGEPASELTVMAIPEDKAFWKVGSSRMRMTGAMKGKFELRGMLAGRYHVVAVPRGRLYLNSDTEPEAFEALIKEATTVVIGEDEKRTVDLRVARDTQER
jgi:hypothetical protein